MSTTEPDQSPAAKAERARLRADVSAELHGPRHPGALISEPVAVDLIATVLSRRADGQEEPVVMAEMLDQITDLIRAAGRSVPIEILTTVARIERSLVDEVEEIRRGQE